MKRFGGIIINIIVIIAAAGFSLLGTFGKLRKLTINLVMSVCPSVRKEHFDYQRRIFMKSDKNNGYFT
jgi:hypothetical protein